jgi:triosephosphate isomerase (TIM)
MTATRKKIAAGNWKMNLDLQSALNLTQDLLHGYAAAVPGADVQVILGVPAPYLHTVANVVAGHAPFAVAAQNMHQAASGAYTGETSATMLRSVACGHVILGHSERRQYFGETDELLASKVQAALAADLTPIFCIGETLEEREADQTFEVVARQMQVALGQRTAAEAELMILAYEPVWAIGTGKTASPEQAQEVHAFLRGWMRQQWGEATAATVPILYGGSVSAANAAQLFACADIDGGLVGGASLKAADFLTICGAFG